MDVLMIGGTRFMGRLAVRKLLEQGHRVTVFTRGNTKPDWWDEVEHIQGDREAYDDFKAKLKGKTFDAVIDSQAYARPHVESAATALQGSIGRYLFVSSYSVYWDRKVDWFTHCPLKESDVSWAELDYSYPEGMSRYNSGKRHSEKWLQENSPVPYTIIRIPDMLGEDDNEERSWWWSQRVLDGGPIVLPLEHQGVFRCLYAADAADAFVRAIQAPDAVNRTYHVGTKEILTIQYWTQMAMDAARSESGLVLVPLRIIQQYAPALHAYAIRERVNRSWPYVPDLSRAERDFGFTTTPVEQWVRSTIEWYKENPESGNSVGYEERSKELALAEKWQKGFDKLLSDI